MNFSILFLTAFLLETALSTTFNWDSVTYKVKDKRTRNLVYQMTPDGSLHLFWKKDQSGFTGYVYQVLLANGTLVDKAVIPVDYYTTILVLSSLQMSDNGQHILLAFEGGAIDPKGEGSDNYVKNFFFESFNGGKDWTEPALIHGRPNDYIARHFPSMVFEKDTGRVYVLYRRAENTYYGKFFNLSLAVRQPGKTQFDSEIILPLVNDTFDFSLVQTADKTSSKRYLQAIVKTREGLLMFSRSEDNGKTWSNFEGIVKYGNKYNKLRVVADSRVIEERVYAQYADRNNNLGISHVPVSYTHLTLPTICSV
eukprot:TRINITY_DN6005_c0_g2_i2.p1 TRINITY_DN6005_c0_g2~~TRINITY_DN6005_c0_g2_i2.p1  ORF type:complete len:310 (+),score=52.34 TRINITY_DN6005_c0_g2_i2:76-1005(+)